MYLHYFFFRENKIKPKKSAQMEKSVAEPRNPVKLFLHVHDLLETPKFMLQHDCGPT